MIFTEERFNKVKKVTSTYKKQMSTVVKSMMIPVVDTSYDHCPMYSSEELSIIWNNLQHMQ